MPKKILFDGYYGHKNTGDDAFVEVTAWGATKYWGVQNCYFLANTIPQTVSDANYYGVSKFKGHNRIKRILQWLSCDGVVSAGGSTFETVYPFYHIRNLGLLKKNFSGSLVQGAIGVSLGPYPSVQAEKEIIEYLKKIDFLALRDEKSYALAMSYNLPYKPVNAFDLAALLPQIYSEPAVYNRDTSNSPMPIIGISICYFERYRNGFDLSKEEKRNRYIEELILQLPEITDVKLRFFEFNGHEEMGDIGFTNLIIEKLKSKGFVNIELVNYKSRTQEMYRSISECSLILSTRLHASIFACFLKIPFILIEYHAKCSDFLESVGYRDEYRVFDGEKSLSESIGIVYSLLSNQATWVDEEKLHICEMKSLRNFNEINWK